VRPIDVIPALAGIALVCLPFLWCRFRNEPPESYGLFWRLTRRGAAECASITIAILAVLTVIAMRWPGEHLPRYSALRRTAGMAINGVSAAVIEEIFFRGWIQPLFRKRFGAPASIAFTGAIFAAAHVFVARAAFILAVFFPGCVMGFLRERHGNISTPTLFHATANIWAIWFVPGYFPTLEEVMKLIGLG